MKLIIHDMDTFTVKQVIDMNESQYGSVNSFCFDGKGNRTVMSMENFCYAVLTDYQAPVHRRLSKLEVKVCYLGSF